MKEHQDKIKEYVHERNWEQFHNPKDLLLGLVEEVGEFRNIIKWEQDIEKIREKIKNNFEEVEDFFGDALWFLASLANYCEVDMAEALSKVIEKNRVRFPVEKWKDKHTNTK